MRSVASSNAGQKPKRRQGGKGRPIQKGQVLNPKGRPVGSRQKLSEKFINVLSADFEQHGEATIKTLRKDKPDVYVRVVADLVPRDVNLNVNATEAFQSAWDFINSSREDDQAQ